MDADRILSYESADTGKISRAALVIFWLSIAAALAFFLVVPAIITLIASVVIRISLNTKPRISGFGYAVWATRMSLASAMFGVVVWMLIPCGSGSRELSNRSVCAATLRGIVQSLNVYASGNSDAYPIVAYAPYSPALNDAHAAAIASSPADVIKNYYNKSSAQSGSLQAIPWQLVLSGDLSPKAFICKSDPFATGPAKTDDGTGVTFDNFQSGHQLSYSMAYPWKADGTVGAWWKGNMDGFLPLFSDMAPEQGTGTPARDVAPKSAFTHASNSGNHQFDGQNVVFGDAHVEMAKSPNIGQDHDNIFTSSATPSVGPAQFGGIPAGKISPMLTADKPPFDIVMYPIRNETTGGM